MTGPATTRRTALGALGGGLTCVLASCRSDPPGDPAADGRTPAPSATLPADPDLAAVDAAMATTQGLLGLLAAGGPALDPGGRLSAMHRAHLDVLGTAGSSASDPASIPASPTDTPSGGQPTGPTPAHLGRREVAAQREFATLAVGAQSGTLARLLASMSAAVAAHLAVPA